MRNNHNQRLLSLLLAVLLLCTLLPATAMTARAETRKGSCGEELYWALNTESGVITILGEGEMENYNIPANQANPPWYDYRDQIKSVVIESGVETIGTNAFKGCANLTDISFADSLTKIGYNAFRDCSSLTSLDIPDSVVSVEMYAFGGCTRLANLRLSASLTEFGSGAFTGCGLTNVTIPEGVAEIGDSGFANCRLLTQLDIPGSVTKIGSFAFQNCSGLAEVNLSEGLEIIDYSAFYGSGIESVVIPDSVTTLGEEAFGDCASLAEISIGSGVESLPMMCFSDCAVESLTIPGNVTQIGAGAVSGCDSLTELVLEEGVQTIAMNAFNGCSVLESVSLPVSLQSIGEWAFAFCGLSELTLPAGVSSVGSCAFAFCFGLTDLTVLNPDCAFGANGNDAVSRTLGFPNTTVLHGYEGSTTQAYAEASNGEFAFVPLVLCPFVDVSGEDYFSEAVLWACDHDPQITAGTDETHFSPELICTRAMIVTFLWRAAGSPAAQLQSCAFTDADPDAYYYPALLWALENGITEGSSATSFGPNQLCTRAQAMTFLWRYAGSPEAAASTEPFVDVSPDAWYAQAVQWAVEHSITAGTSEHCFSPKQFCTRAQILTFLYLAEGAR